MMSWQPPRGCCRDGCVCRNVEGRGAEAGCSGSQEGTWWGKGGERPKWKGSLTVCQSHTHGPVPNAYQ